MPSNCVICGNSAMKDPGVSFHRLPSSADRKRQWLEAFDVPEEEWCTHWRVCSRHFPDGNPKAAPLSYREDHFANMWSLRKRAKLDHSRSATPARQPQPQQLQQQQQQVKRNNLNSILALRGGPALSRPLPVINNTASMEEQATVHARPPPVLLPVASLPPNHHLVGGPITVITREPLNLVPTSSQHQLHKGVVPGGIHVHELVVVPEVGPSDEATSESSGTDESLTTGAREGGGSGGDYEVAADIDSGEHVLELTGGNNMTGYYRGSTSSGEGEAAQRINHTGSSPAHAVSRINHTGLSSTPCSTASRTDRVVQSGEGRDVSVMVQSALLAHVAVLENDNRQLRQKLPPPSTSTSSPLLGVSVSDSSTGRPAEGVPVEVSVWQSVTADWTPLSSGVTGSDGECFNLLSQAQRSLGLFRLHFDTQSYFTSQGHTQPHYPYIEVVFRVYRGTSNHRVSLQLSPFSYTTSSHTQ